MDMEDVNKKIYNKYKPFIKNELLYFTDTVFDYFDSTVPNEHEIAVIKIKKNFNYENNTINIIELGENLKYIVGFLYPSEFMEKENTYNFKCFWIYNDETEKKELRLSSFTIISDIILKRNNNSNKINIKFDKDNFDEIEDIFIIRVKDLIDNY
jgi:hypothetical protein